MKGGSTYRYEVKRGLRGAVPALRKCAKSPHKGQAVDFMSGRNGMWHQGHLVSHLKDFEHKDCKALE